MKSEFKKLDELIDHLRSKGVLSYKAEGVELVLLPNEPPKPEKEKKHRKSLDEALDGEGKKKGADGLTAEQQEDLYGVTLDAGT